MSKMIEIIFFDDFDGDMDVDNPQISITYYTESDNKEPHEMHYERGPFLDRLQSKSSSNVHRDMSYYSNEIFYQKYKSDIIHLVEDDINKSMTDLLELEAVI